MWLGFVTLSGLLGILLGWEKSFYGQAGRYLHDRGVTRLICLTMFALGVASQVSTVQGFSVIFLSSLGAYYLASHLGGWVEKKWSNFRGRSPNFEIRNELYRPNLRVFSIDTRELPPAYIETLFLRRESGEVVKPRSAKLGETDLKIRADGWLNGLEIPLEPNSRAAITLDVEDWASVYDYRIIGRWANGVIWLIDGNMIK